MNKVKQVVMFQEFLGWMEHASGAVTATLGGVEGHPLLGTQPWVRTSAVKRIEYDTTKAPSVIEIETLNTIYHTAAGHCFKVTCEGDEKPKGAA